MMLRRSLWDPSAIDGHGTEGGAAPDGGILLPDHGAFQFDAAAPADTANDWSGVGIDVDFVDDTLTFGDTTTDSPAALDPRPVAPSEDNAGIARRKPRGPRASTGGSRPISTTIRAGFRASSRSRRPIRPPARPATASRRRIRRREPIRKSQRFGMWCPRPSTGRLRPISMTIRVGFRASSFRRRRPTTTIYGRIPTQWRIRIPLPATARTRRKRLSQDVERALTYDEVSAQYPGIVWPVNWWLL